ncbi:MAG: sodium ion-translocating decarboxylase subunit beta [Smithellaceae bacterium]|nr:sodium ion-translocating decarboxylase subunit beta [Smithellaceae bacterium]
MTWDAVANIFQGVTTLVNSFSQDPKMAFARIGLILLGFLLIYMGKKGYLEALLMIPMGLGMATVNAAIMFFDPLNLHGGVGTFFVEAQAGATVDAVKNAAEIITVLQINWLQPIYTMTFSNGLIACLIFMGIGALLDVGYVMARPFQSMFIAVCAELGTIITFPVAQLFGYTPQQAAAISIVGGADGPMVLFTSLRLAPELFVPIAIIAYLYLGFAYGGYPYLIRAMVPKKLLAIKPPPPKKKRDITSGEKMLFAVVACVFLSFLLPVAAPLIFSLFFGVVIRESGIKEFINLLQGPILYGSTMFLGLMLGVLCDVNTIMDPKVLPLLLLGMLALLISGIGGILGGYLLYFITRGKFNPAIGIAGVSCTPTTSKVAQKVVSKVNRTAIILPDALGANVSGVITTAIISGIFCSLLAK